MNLEAAAFDSGLGRQVRQSLELGDELGPAVGITRIVKRVDPDEDVARAAGLGQPQRQAQKDRVARRHVGDRDALAYSLLGHSNIAGQRRAPERTKVEGQHDMAVGEVGGDPARSVQLDPVALVVIDRERDDRETPFARDRRADHRIEPAGQQDDRLSHSLMPSLGAAQNQPA